MIISDVKVQRPNQPFSHMPTPKAASVLAAWCGSNTVLQHQTAARCNTSCCAVAAVQSSDHMAADIPLMHSDSLRPLVVNSMQLAVQQLRQHPQAHDCGVSVSCKTLLCVVLS